MARTKQEIRSFLDSMVGKTCVDKSDARLNGQCVCLIKNLMEFLGVPNPYAARGHAKDVGSNYIAQGIGVPGRGWLTICVNRNMGGGYGHVWCDTGGEANYESNGAIPLRTTKNTRPLAQAQQLINFDKWVTEGGSSMAEKLTLGPARILVVGILGRDPNYTHAGKGDADLNAHHVGKELTNGYIDQLWKSPEANAWGVKRASLEAFYNKYSKLVGELEARPTKAQLEALQEALAKESAKVSKAETKLEEERQKRSEDTVLLDEAGNWLTKLFNRIFKR